ncbi:hypothetical protein [Siccirubricoccus sp. G192]|uniref:hypothetical protein n=1 Tax=Siccirubricoccus sp. G192 TaxID=2849651 RepID=UPI001C2CB4D8|nr:hypothetical protein [Siccirubricoccus sp. G192]MBV1800620.1 hypothetical protein [Siccirubricoccus sp. G192]MBV1800684.1 hypothetical protein [Siccirubricoccus sp. G192]
MAHRPGVAARQAWPVRAARRMGAGQPAARRGWTPLALAWRRARLAAPRLELRLAQRFELLLRRGESCGLLVHGPLASGTAPRGAAASHPDRPNTSHCAALAWRNGRPDRTPRSALAAARLRPLLQDPRAAAAQAPARPGILMLRPLLRLPRANAEVTTLSSRRYPDDAIIAPASIAVQWPDRRVPGFMGPLPAGPAGVWPALRLRAAGPALGHLDASASAGLVRQMAPIEAQNRAPLALVLHGERGRARPEVARLTEAARRLDLVWRLSEAAAADGVGAGGSTTHAAPSQAVSIHTALAQATLREAADAPLTAAAPAAMPRTAVPARAESAPSERFVDDVVRRIERRLRIDRERRGL